MKTGIENLMYVFKSQNKILNPVKGRNVIPIDEQIASLFAVGTFYYFLMNFVTLSIEYVSGGTKTILGVAPETYSLELFLSLLHPEDLENLHKKEAASFHFKIDKIAREDITNYKTVYLIRLRDKQGRYRSILHQAKPLTVSDDGKVQMAISIHTDVTYLKIPFDHDISFISTDHTKPSFHYKMINDKYVIVERLKQNFTKREKEIVILLGQGKKSREIAEILFISELTVNTHKKNILRKSNSINSSQLITKCIREGLI